MTNGEVRKVSLQDIQLVQNLIERCLQLYMSQREVVNTLLHQAKIETGFTELVWQKLEAENQEFFRAYHMRLMVKDQIVQFNQLLERQVELMRQVNQTGVVPISLSNGSQHHSMHHSTAYQSPQLAVPTVKPENMHHQVGAVPNVYANGRSSLPQHMQVAVNMTDHGGRINVPANMLLAQSSNVGMMHGLNGGMIKTEGCSSPVMFGTDANVPEPRNPIGEASVSPFSGGESSSHVLNDTMLDPETNSFGFLGQINRNFSLSDLTADFSNSTDILESYSRSPFLETDANYLDPRIRGEQQGDIRSLDPMSSGFRYNDFGSD